MRILYDGFIYSLQTAGGINRYFSNIIQRLPGDLQPFLAIPTSNKLNFPKNPNLKLIKYHKLPAFRYSGVLEKMAFYGKMKLRNTFDLQHPTYYGMLTPNKYNPVRATTVRTVYDMIHELYPQNLDPTGYQTMLKKKTITTADFIICISKNTKKDLIELYRVPEEKIKVIYIASEFNLSMARGPEEIPDKPYFLYVGNREAAYKNFNGLLESFEKIAKSYPDVYLTVVGAGFNTRETAKINELKLTTQVRNFGYTSDNHLAKLYRHSLAFVYPSLYEGFGIPPLEAMACGGLVVTTNRASLPEVVGDAALIFDPDLKDSLTFLLEQLCNGFSHRAEYLAKGFERAGLFSWDKTADQTVKLYRTLGS